MDVTCLKQLRSNTSNPQISGRATEYPRVEKSTMMVPKMVCPMATYPNNRTTMTTKKHRISAKPFSMARAITRPVGKADKYFLVFGQECESSR